MSESDNKLGIPFAKQKLTLSVAALGLAGLVSWAGWTAFQGPSSPSVSPVASAFAAGDSSGKSDREVASINGMKITEMELGVMLQSGVDRAIVIDRYINKVVAAERGREMYVEEAKAALRAAELRSRALARVAAVGRAHQPRGLRRVRLRRTDAGREASPAHRREPGADRPRRRQPLGGGLGRLSGDRRLRALDP